MRKQEINPVRALELRQGPPKRSWRETARLLSIEDGRVPPYQPESLTKAILVFQGRAETAAKRYAREKQQKAATT